MNVRTRLSFVCDAGRRAPPEEVNSRVVQVPLGTRSSPELLRALFVNGRQFYQLEWVTGTGGGISIKRGSVMVTVDLSITGNVVAIVNRCKND